MMHYWRIIKNFAALKVLFQGIKSHCCLSRDTILGNNLHDFPQESYRFLDYIVYYCRLPSLELNGIKTRSKRGKGKPESNI